MANNSTPINVNVNFNGVSYNSQTGVWSGNPTWNIQPSNAEVPPSKSGDTMTVQWNLNAAAVPQGFSAAFPSNGIAFKANSGWTGGTPTQQNATTVSATDTFDGLGQNQTYNYTTTVVLSNADGSVTQTFTLDPDVENEAGTASLTHAAG